MSSCSSQSLQCTIACLPVTCSIAVSCSNAFLWIDSVSFGILNLWIMIAKYPHRTVQHRHHSHPSHRRHGSESEEELQERLRKQREERRLAAERDRREREARKQRIREQQEQGTYFLSTYLLSRSKSIYTFST